MNRVKISILIGIMCLLLSMGTAIQIKTVNDTSPGVGKTQTENALRDSVLRWKEKYESITKEESEKEEELEELREQVSNYGSDSTNLSQQLEEANTLLGYNQVKGQGLIITLKDAKAANYLNATNFVVHDADLLEVVNALKNAGAEAISINEQRITGQSTITCVGNTIKVDGKKVGSPFEIKAIGLIELLNGALTMPGGYLKLLEQDGIQVKVETSNEITIPKYEGTYNFEYAQNVED